MQAYEQRDLLDSGVYVCVTCKGSMLSLLMQSNESSCSFRYLILFVEQLVKLLELREANHIEFCRIKNVVDEVLHMTKNPELSEILKLLMDPTWVATGLKIDFETLVSFFYFMFLFSCSFLDDSIY